MKHLFLTYICISLFSAGTILSSPGDWIDDRMREWQTEHKGKWSYTDLLRFVSHHGPEYGQSLFFFTRGRVVRRNIEYLKKNNECRNCYLELASLDELNLSGADLSDANLREARIKCTNFSGANLKGADLSCAQAEESNFEKANLENSSIALSHMSRANFSYARMQQACLNGSTLESANFTGADLTDAALKDTHDARNRYRKINLTDARFEQANLTGTRFQLRDWIRIHAYRALRWA